MRTPGRKRPSFRCVYSDLPPETDLEALSLRASYVGSPEHKDTPSFAGRPAPRADATLCDPSFIDRQDEIERWLREGIRRGWIGGPLEGDFHFPLYVWYLNEGKVYEARLINRSQGQYKGWVLEEEEWPKGLVT